MTETEGQPSEESPAAATTGAGTESNVTGQETAPSGTPQQAEESFFDPESIKDKPELMAAYKQMQSAFTKKTTALRESGKKVEAYDAFMRDPIANIQSLAGQYGYTLPRGQAEQVLQQQGQGQFNPQTWEEVFNTAEQRVLQKLNPFLNEVKETRKSQVEKMLDDNCPDWRVYEDQMMKTLQSHPTMVNDPVKLYRMSVPDEILQSRAAQAAIKKLQTKAESSQASSGSSTNKQASDIPKGPMSFQKAVEVAKAQLAAKGIRSPN